MTMSAHSAMSDPPPTHQPCTWVITGLRLRQRLMNFGTGAVKAFVAAIMSFPGSQRPLV
jgi:hypothetical protein